MRLPAGGRIDRTCPISFTWDGRELSGFAGDTLASALLANGARIVARSAVLGRPRGIFTAGAEEPNAFVQLRAPWDEPLVAATRLDLVPKVAKKKEINTVLSNSCGFGGTNASLIMRRFAA